MLCSVGVAMGGWLNLFRQSSKRKERMKRISDCGAESGWEKKTREIRETKNFFDTYFLISFRVYISSPYTHGEELKFRSNFSKKNPHSLYISTWNEIVRHAHVASIVRLLPPPTTTTTTWTLFFISFSFHLNFSTIRICKSCCVPCQISACDIQCQKIISLLLFVQYWW